MRTIYTIVISAIIATTPILAHSQDAAPPPKKEQPSIEQVKKDFLETTRKIQKDPKNIDLYYRHAQAAMRLGKIKDAVNSYKRMLKLDPKLDKIRLSLATIYMRQQKFKEAKKLFEEVLANNPPEKVKANVQRAIEAAEKGIKESPEKKVAQKAVPKPSEEELAKLKKKINANGKDYDSYFAYAKMATVLGKFEEAEGAYQYLLQSNPKLGRVKLELAMLYAKTGKPSKLKESKKLLETVLAENPPKNVENNIKLVLSQVDQALKKDMFQVALSFGVNRDSNATSAASTGETTFNDISLPLAANSTASPDAQIVANVSATHMHKFEIDSDYWGATLATNGMLYKSNQSTEHQLDISLASVTTGPTFTLKKLNTQIGFTGGYNVIVLNSFKYIKTRSGEAKIKYALNNKWSFDTAFKYEYRKFANSPSAATNTLRTGNAYQWSGGVTYAHSPKDVFNITTMQRNENARVNYYGQSQISVSGTHVHNFPLNISLTTALNFKKSHYSAPDPSISATQIRTDRERSATFTVAKKWPKNITTSIGYQYKNITSNIQNYDYYNHRFSTNIGWSF